MPLPTSGTYKLTVITLNLAVSSGGASAEYRIGQYNNVMYQGAEVTFNNGEITWLIRSGNSWIGGSAKIANPIPSKGYAVASSAIYQDIEGGGYILLANENDPGYYGLDVLKKNYQTGVWSTRNSLYYPNEKDTFQVCFLSGTLIETPSGRVCVEDLCIGDDVIVYDADGSSRTDTLKYVGKAQSFVRQNAHPDKAGYPVRILKDAIAEGVPFKDLLVTSEHCLFFDGKFIPARMLVNGSSIYYDTSFTSYEYFHIETEKHSVVMADGMLTESYLDTGNRNAFLQDGPLFSLGRREQDAKTWDRDAAAPLTVDSAVVEPLYRQIEERAKNMQRVIKAEPVSLTEEMDLCLKTDRGQVIRPVRQSADKIIFMIPEQARAVRIVSNASRPCDTIGPFIDDRRELGVLVGEINLYVSNQTTLLTEHLQDKGLEGWHNLEESPMRWTDGNALLPLSDAFEGPAILTIQVIAAGPYLIQNEQSSNTRSVA